MLKPNMFYNILEHVGTLFRKNWLYCVYRMLKPNMFYKSLEHVGTFFRKIGCIVSTARLNPTSDTHNGINVSDHFPICSKTFYMQVDGQSYEMSAKSADDDDGVCV